MSWEDLRSVIKDPMSMEWNRRKEWSVGRGSGVDRMEWEKRLEQARCQRGCKKIVESETEKRIILWSYDLYKFVYYYYYVNVAGDEFMRCGFSDGHEWNTEETLSTAWRRSMKTEDGRSCKRMSFNAEVVVMADDSKKTNHWESRCRQRKWSCWGRYVACCGKSSPVVYNWEEVSVRQKRSGCQAVIQVRECGRVERIKNATKNASREVRGRRQEGEENRCKDITAQVVY